MKAKQVIALVFAVLLAAVAPFAASAVSAAPLAAPATAAQDVEVAPGYDYSRFQGQNITLNVYNWGEYISMGTDGESLDVNGAFEELTGIKVNYTNFDTNEAMYSKLKSGGGDYDVIFPSDYMIGKMAAEGMLAELDFANIPNYAMIGEQYKNQNYDPKNQYSVPYTWGYVGIIYNTTMVDEAPTSWNVLWDDKYEGNVLMFDNSRDAFAIALKKLGFSLNPETKEQIDLAAAELERQKSVVQAYVMDQIYDKMEGGEAALAPYYAGDFVQMAEENPDLAFAVPKEGTNIFIDAMCVPATSGNKEAAEMYINFLCETQVARENIIYIGYSTPQTEAEASLPPEVRDDPVRYPGPEVLANTEAFSTLPDELNSYMDKAWSDMRSTSSGGSGWIILAALGVAIVIIAVLFWRRSVAKKRSNY